MWTCLCGAWNEPERTHCAECGVNANETALQLSQGRYESQRAEISAILYGPKVDVPEDITVMSGPKLNTPFDEFPDDIPF